MSSPLEAPPNPAVSPSTRTPTPEPAAIRSFGVLPWDEPASADGQLAGASEAQREDFDPRSAYVETFWLPIIGPSTTLLMRRLADEFDAAPAGFEIDAAVLSREIGLGQRLGQNSSFMRTLHRCTMFNLMQLDGHVVYVRRRIPQLRPKQVGRLSQRLQLLHESWTLPPVDDGAQRRSELIRAAHLARTLLALGETEHDVETQLHRWHVHPSIAWHAVQWALTGADHLP